MESAKYYVGIDPSYSGTGIVILGGEEVIAHAFKAGKPEHPFHERVHDLWKQILRVLPKPDECIICIEGAAYAAEFNAFMLGELSGALKYCMYSNGYKYEVVQPTVVKKFATGAGNAQKHFVAAHVAQKWGFVNSSNDVVDAFVLAKISEAGGPKLVTELMGATKKKKARKAKDD
jgi:crossover junction endodeoxyribonuclease RuvC